MYPKFAEVIILRHPVAFSIFPLDVFEVYTEGSVRQEACRGLLTEPLRDNSLFQVETKEYINTG